jgi:hypothetical protein
MIVERNRIMIARLDSLLKLKTVFTGVGAAHLPGEDGMINMLRELGYTVEACEKVITDETMAKRKEIDKLRYELSFETHYPSDSVFSVSVPGEFSVIPSIDDYTQMYHPDPINGSYFAVLRLRTYADLYNKSRDDIFMMIDSLFYENIPGEIQEKKEINLQGFRCFDITIKLVRGDYQRYKIFITPLEIILFKMSGPDDFVTMENNSEFFDSVKFNFTHYSEPHKYHDGRGGFDINLPGMAVSNFNVEDSRNEEFREIVSVDTNSGEFFMMRRTSIFDFEYIEEDTFELNYVIEQYADARDFLIKEMQLATYKQFPSIDATVEKDDLKLNLRVIKKGVEFFLLIAKTEDDDHRDNFFNSLEFTDLTDVSEYISCRDTLFHFTVTSPKQPADNILQEVMKDLRTISTRDKTPFETKYKSTFYTEPLTGQLVRIEFVRLHKYYSEKHIDSFWTYRRERMLNDSTLKIYSYDTDSSDGLYTMNVRLVDTNSIKMIRKKLI